METAPLKSFATWARTALIREVTARIAVVLAPASAERVEQPKAVEALEKAVNAAGGGEKGKVAVADRVAYTWFNRIIALRFMDANGYTGTGVVSPQAGLQIGQPEILADAKRGNIDATVVGSRTRETVTGLLNGTRRSEDAQGEAYALLLADYCRYWNRAMPFMFEREGDFTEVLIPANLLADDSVLNRAVKVLTTDVCEDVEVIGWLYQFYISERKDEVFAGFKKNKKAGADEIPAATQLFTPHWIVRYLVENSLGRLWVLNRPSSRLVEQMEYYIAPVDEETDFLKIGSPEELKVIDPACGSGHMLTYAFDLLYTIYEEEGYAPAEIPGLILTNNLYGAEIDPRAGVLAAFALTMKARAKQRMFFKKQVEPNVCVLDPIRFTLAEIDFLLTRGGDQYVESTFWNQFEHADMFGSLIQAGAEPTARLKQHLSQLDDGGDMLNAEVIVRAERVILQATALSNEYAVVVANPPYMGAKNMNAKLAEWIRAHQPASKSDLFAAFIERCLSLSKPSGFVGMVTMQNWMFLSSFQELRKSIATSRRILTMAHLGTNAFDSIAGEVVSTTAFVIENRDPGSYSGVYLRLVSGKSEAEKQALLATAAHDSQSDCTYRAKTEDMGKIPGSPLAYWLTKPMIDAFVRGEALGRLLSPRVGLQTGDNGRFVRAWYEVGLAGLGLSMESRRDAETSGRRWFPYNKGGELRRWYGNQEFVVNWERDGQEVRNFKDAAGKLRSRPQNVDFYFRRSITWSDITTKTFAARSSPVGFIFDVKGSSGFPPSGRFNVVLALLNSALLHDFMQVLNPTTTFQVGDLARVPYLEPAPEIVTELDANTTELVRLSSLDWDSFETSWSFLGHGLVANRSVAPTVQSAVRDHRRFWDSASQAVHDLEERNDRLFESVYGLPDRSTRPSAHIEPLSREKDSDGSLICELVSYAVGCMFGRYSLDEPGLILADQGATLQDYLDKIPSPTFAPDKDNVIPIVDGDWFEDDVVARFRTFLRATYGEQYFEQNLRFVTESLGVKDIGDYFMKSFYKDHVRRYKKRPIYWLFSSPKGSFNALIYMYRYTPSTVSTVLNEYLREFIAKLTSSLQQQERLAAGGGTPRQQAAAHKKADRLRKALLELREYEHDVLYPLASRQLSINLDDGVKANYPKFGDALKKIPGLEASDE